ncbi:precorrin-2 C(20)-methyltransferase [Rhodococcus aerolatus]
MAGTLYGVGLGPGDPELVTVKAARLVAAADVVAYHCAQHGRSIARTIAEPYLRAGQLEECLTYPVTTETATHPGGYTGAIEEFYTEAAERLATHLEAGRDVVLLAEGDPLFYSSYMHMHKRLAGRFATEVVPGVTSPSAASAAAGTPLVQHEDVLTVLPGGLDADTMARHLADADAAVVMKIARRFGTVRDALKQSGRVDDALFVERASTGVETVRPVTDVDGDTVPYMSLVLVPGRTAAAPVVPDEPGPGEVVVVGLGPGGPEWLTPEARAELAAAEHLVGYVTYVDRVPVRAGQQRHASDNRVEAERAAFALDLARRGHRVAVVSSGDPGVFAMAAAVLEVAQGDGTGATDVPVRVVPGLTAAQAVASRVGAPLGHDFATISLSDQLKPWSVIRERLDAIGRADLVVAIYNPASRTRREQVAEARDLMLTHRSPDTPVVVGRAVGSDVERVAVVRLADLDPADVDMRTMLIIGSTQTRAVVAPDGTTTVWTPRSYPADGQG